MHKDFAPASSNVSGDAIPGVNPFISDPLPSNMMDTAPDFVNLQCNAPTPFIRHPLDLVCPRDRSAPYYFIRSDNGIMAIVTPEQVDRICPSTHHCLETIRCNSWDLAATWYSVYFYDRLLHCLSPVLANAEEPDPRPSAAYLAPPQIVVTNPTPPNVQPALPSSSPVSGTQMSPIVITSATPTPVINRKVKATSVGYTLNALVMPEKPWAQSVPSPTPAASGTAATLSNSAKVTKNLTSLGAIDISDESDKERQSAKRSKKASDVPDNKVTKKAKKKSPAATTVWRKKPATGAITQATATALEQPVATAVDQIKPAAVLVEKDHEYIYPRPAYPSAPSISSSRSYLSPTPSPSTPVKKNSHTYQPLFSNRHEPQDFFKPSGSPAEFLTGGVFQPLGPPVAPKNMTDRECEVYLYMKNLYGPNPDVSSTPTHPPTSPALSFSTTPHLPTACHSAGSSAARQSSLVAPSTSASHTSVSPAASTQYSFVKYNSAKEEEIKGILHGLAKQGEPAGDEDGDDIGGN